jgi:hypothetical protein
MITPAALSSKLRKTSTASTILPPQFVAGSWQVVQTAQAGTVEISSSVGGWNINAE